MSHRKGIQSGNGNRGFGLQGAGKGDGDRSPGWRDKYHDVNWPDGGINKSEEGFVRKGGKLIKVYGTPETKPEDRAPNIKVK